MSVRRVVALVFGASLLYAAVRYHLFGGVPWADLPLYTANKALALAAVALIAASYWAGRLARRPGLDALHAWPKGLGLAGFGLAALHSLASLALLGPHYYGKFYGADGGFTWAGSLTMLTGVLGLFVFALPALASLPNVAHHLGRQRWRAYQRMGYVGLLLTAGHVLAMGLGGWLQPAEWPGGLAPISLLGFAVALLGLAARLAAMARRDAAAARAPLGRRARAPSDAAQSTPS